MGINTDRVGIGWRHEMASGILRNLDAVDVLEVVAESHTQASQTAVNVLRTLAAQLPVFVHAVSLGLASNAPVDARRLHQLARFIDRVRPAGWSEHLAFVRAGGFEMGHLAAPPRTAANVEGARRNLQRARLAIGSMPHLENIARLMEPPGCELSELAWTAHILEESGSPLLLDLHNLYANARNFGFDATAFIRALPPSSIGMIHIAGGSERPNPSGNGSFYLDDHRHDVPPEVLTLLRHTAAHATGPLTVILERDGEYPAMPQLLSQLDQARKALRQGRADALARKSS